MGGVLALGKTHLQISSVGTVFNPHFQAPQLGTTVFKKHFCIFTLPRLITEVLKKFSQFQHFHTSIFSNFSIQDTFPHFHTSMVGTLGIQDTFPDFHISAVSY